MKRHTRSGFLAGTLLGAVLAFAGAAGAHSTQGGNDGGGMMRGGTMASMHEMMAQCSDMMSKMQTKHDAQPDNEQSATGVDDAS